MNYAKKRERLITNEEQAALAVIKKFLGEMPNEKMFLFIKIKCATEDGFFDKMMKAAFAGYYTHNDNLKEEVSVLSTALFMAEMCIPKQKKKQAKFKKTFKYAILKGLKIARNFLNIDDVVAEYDD